MLISESLNEFGGFLTPDEAVDWATKQFTQMGDGDRYSMIEVYRRNEQTNRIELYKKLLATDFGYPDKNNQSQAT